MSKLALIDCWMVTVQLNCCYTINPVLIRRVIFDFKMVSIIQVNDNLSKKELHPFQFIKQIDLANNLFQLESITNIWFEINEQFDINWLLNNHGIVKVWTHNQSIVNRYWIKE